MSRATDKCMLGKHSDARGKKDRVCVAAKGEEEEEERERREGKGMDEREEG